MPLEEFLRSTTGFVTGISALVGSLAALAKVLVEYRTERVRSREESASAGAREMSPLITLLKKTSFAIFVALGVVAGLILVPRLLLSDKPSVRIDTPSPSQPVKVRRAPTGSGSFTVSGSSSAVFKDPDLRIYVLVHPADPFAAGWWIQRPALVDTTGSWTAECWIGNADFPPHPGDKVDIVSVAAEPHVVGGRLEVDDPKDLMPAAQSGIVRFSLGANRGDG